MSGREKTEKTYRRQCLSWKLFMGEVVAQFKDLLACCCAHEQRGAAQEVCLCFSFEKIMQKLMKCITSFSSLLESFGWPGEEEESALDKSQLHEQCSCQTHRLGQPFSPLSKA